MAGAIRTLPGMAILRPNQQGRLDRLCGIYSIINGIELAIFPERLMPAQRKALFDEGIAFLARSKRLETVAQEGMSERLWIRLRDALLAAVSASSGQTLQAMPLPPPHADIGIRELLSWTKRNIVQGRPVLLGLWGVYDHFTVVGGISAKNLLLYDSFGFQHVLLSSLAVRTPRTTARHKISRTGVAAIVVQT